MKARPIYVELEIAAAMDDLWKHTQDPSLHVQWDLRFTDITYLQREQSDDFQRFLYRTRLGFGLDISGTGESRSSMSPGSKERLSTLVFGSEQPISLIRQGSGYWRYRQKGNSVAFSTKFDYETRFGLFGHMVDRLLFRPLFGYATAWSFDMLRIWLERGIAPVVSLQRAVVHYACLSILVMLWLYEGLVPKLLFPEAGEQQLFRASGLFPGAEEVLLPLLGLAEILLGLVTVIAHRRKAIYVIQSMILTLLTFAALTGNPELLASPFNPLTLCVPMLVLCLLASITAADVPCAGRCRRRMPAAEPRKGGKRCGIHLRESTRR